jgi:hypothetical protein
MPKLKRQEATIDWKKSEARAVLIKDLTDGVLPLDDAEVSAEEAWATCYTNLPEFSNVGFEQFKRQLKAHRKQLKEKTQAADTQEAALLHDRVLYPERTHYASGVRIFRMSPALPLLQADIQSGRHNELTPSALRASRPEYAEWELKVFTQRIYQQVRRQKFINYLEWKREQKKDVKVGGDDMSDNASDIRTKMPRREATT